MLEIISDQKVTTLARVGAVGGNTFWSAARRNLGVRSWELHCGHRRDTLFYTKWARRLKPLILIGLRRVLCEVDWGRPNSGQYLELFLDVILELEAETLSELRFFHARSDHIGFRSWFCWNGWVFFKLSDELKIFENVFICNNRSSYQ